MCSVETPKQGSEGVRYDIDAFCYNCAKMIKANEEGECAECGETFVEIMAQERSNNNQTNRRTNANTNSASIINGSGTGHIIQSVQIGPGAVVNSVRVTDVTGTVPNVLSNIFRSIPGRFSFQISSNIPPNLNANIGDYFLGSEDGFRAVIENLPSGRIGTPPATEEQISKLNVVKYSSDMDVDSSCPICIESYNEDDDVVILPCKHCFHKDCLFQWLKEHSECPSCRHSIDQTE